MQALGGGPNWKILALGRDGQRIGYEIRNGPTNKPEKKNRTVKLYICKALMNIKTSQLQYKLI